MRPKAFPTPTGVLLATGLLVAGLMVAACATETRPERTASPEILWDSWGVPHIFAESDADLLYGFGWAQAANHADLLLRLFGESRGRGAEYWGERHLDLDRWIRTMDVPRRAARWLEEQDDEMRFLLDAFAAGINDYAAANPDAVADEMEVVLPVTPTDLMAHVQRLVHFTFMVNPREIAGVRSAFAEAGSNAWAIGPERSASGNAILVANPHLYWGDLFTMLEVQLVAPNVDAYGTAMVGTPFLGFGFNDALGWTHTVNTHDGDDLFRLELAPGGYVFDDEIHPFETEEVLLQVRQPDGSLRGEPLTILRSLHGPVVAANGNEALALRVAGLDTARIARQYWDMTRARNLAEFETAVRSMQAPMFTFMYADRDGNILHHFGGHTPVRPRGDWATWSRPVPGNTSDWLWSDVHTYDELPTTRNPESGWLQNANDPPWTTTFPRALEAERFPSYMAPRFMHLRAQRSAALLAEDESLTFDEVVAYKLSNRMALADRILDDLDEAVTEHGDAAALRAMQVLSSWDRTADRDSRGAVLFAAFVAAMESAGQGLETPFLQAGFARPWNPDAPRTTPDGLADPATAASALGSAAASVEEKHGRLDVLWGEVNRVRRNGYDFAGNGAPGGLGVFRVANFAPDGETTARAVSGDSWVAVVEFGDALRAEVLLSYGNSSQPDSPHNGDQLALFSEKKLRPVWRTREEIESNLVSRESPSRR